MTNEEAIKIMEQREHCMECVVEDFTCKDCDMAFEMAIKSIKQIEKIKSIINDPFYFRGMPVYMQEDVLKYKAICEVLGCKTV